MSESEKAVAKTDSAPDADAAKRLKARVEGLLARPAVLHDDSVLLDSGLRLAYQVRAGFIPVLGSGLGPEASEPQAAVFTTAYLASETSACSATAPRPVCFAFNGGPGSSSIWLHLGALGPKRVPVNDYGTLAPAPYVWSTTR